MFGGQRQQRGGGVRSDSARMNEQRRDSMQRRHDRLGSRTSPRTHLDTGRKAVGGYAGVAREGADLLARRRKHVDKGPADGAGCAGYKYHG